jgi:hypothetical protein
VDAEASFEIERRLVAQIRSTGPLRAAQAEIASWLVHRRAWEKLGYARLSDYADERLGRSARSVLDLAHVGLRLQYLSKLRTALVEGRLGWTRVRLVARVTDRLSTSEEQERWIAHARGVTTQNLSREVRKVDRQSIEEGGLDRDKRPSKMFEVACTPEVRGRWLSAQGLASRVNGGRLSLSGAAELMAAEVLSAIPIDPDIADAAEVDEVDSGPGTSWPEAAAAARAECAQRLGLDEDGEGDGEGGGGGTGETAEEGGQVGANGAGLPTIPAEIQALMEDVENADAFELDRCLRAAVAMEQRLDAQIGPLLEWVIRRRVYLVLGYPTREAYVSERLGLDPSWGRALVRIERAARASSSLASAYRQGSVTALQARTLAPLVMTDLSERWMEAWVDRAQRFTLRRLREDVDQALLVCETDFTSFLGSGGIPADGADDEASLVQDREISASQSAPKETSAVRAYIDAEVVRTLRALICTVQRRLERATGRLPTKGEALDAMLEHVFQEWGAIDGAVRKSHAIFARDGWRCTVPGCSSMRNLHDHHIVFRSAGGSDDLDNRVTLCAFHHLRGVHAGIIRCTGKAPHRLRITLGVRPDQPDRPPIATYASGDRLVAAL